MNAPLRWTKPAPPAPGETFRVIPQFIDRREVFDEEDGGGSLVRLGLSKADKSRIGADRIEIDCLDGDPIIHQQLDVTVTGFKIEYWGFNYQAVIIEATASIVPFEPSFQVKVDGLSAADCRSLEKRFGPDFAVKIAADNELISATRFSPEKRAMIILACKAEKDAAEGDTASAKKVMALLCACGDSKGRARKLASMFVKARSPYQHLLAGRLSFKEGDRFAHLLDPVRAGKDRPMAILIDRFLDTKSIVVSRDGKEGLDAYVNRNFGMGPFKTTTALEKLRETDAHDPGGKVRLRLLPGIKGTASFSECRRYRLTTFLGIRTNDQLTHIRNVQGHGNVTDIVGVLGAWTTRRPTFVLFTILHQHLHT